MTAAQRMSTLAHASACSPDSVVKRSGVAIVLIGWSFPGGSAPLEA